METSSDGSASTDGVSSRQPRRSVRTRGVSVTGTDGAGLVVKLLGSLGIERKLTGSTDECHPNQRLRL